MRTKALKIANKLQIEKAGDVRRSFVAGLNRDIDLSSGLCGGTGTKDQNRQYNALRHTVARGRIVAGDC